MIRSSKGHCSLLIHIRSHIRKDWIGGPEKASVCIGRVYGEKLPQLKFGVKTNDLRVFTSLLRKNRKNTYEENRFQKYSKSI